MENDDIYPDYCDGYSDDMEYTYEDYDPYDYSFEETVNLYGGGFSAYSLRDLWDSCLVWTLGDGSKATLRLLGCCILFKIIASFRIVPPSSIHLASVVIGIFTLYLFFGFDIGYVLTLSVIGLTILTLTSRVFGIQKHGLLCCIICVLYLVTCELFVVEKVRWHKIRGPQMILTMKIISLGFDMDEKPNNAPTALQCLGYFFCSGNIIFGPWVPFADYTSLIHRPMNFTWIFKTLLSVVMAMIFLSISTCWIEWIFPTEPWIWVAAYRDALSFRTSHYFVCFLSEASALAAGMSTLSHTWSMNVAAPLQIEIPRSLVEVVIYWNIPMHTWLKTYVYKTARPFGKFPAILSTFIASSVLHGLNFQLAAVLVSLGFYTYVEYVFRAQLADMYDACILARKCKKDCAHKYKNNNGYVFLTNIGFGFLSAFHLAYLGVMFNTSQQEEEVLIGLQPFWATVCNTH